MTRTADISPSAVAARTQCSPQQRITRSLLGYGVIAGPFYVVVSLAQAAVRDGFDLTRHEWSLLANGTGGWVQTANLVITGLMVVAAAIGFRRTMSAGVGRRWAPRLLATYGLSLVAAGVFRADPINGFPIGTPAGPPAAATLHGTLHFVCGGIGFLALIIATFVIAAQNRREGLGRRASWSIGTGVAFLAAFIGIASGATTAAVNLAFTAAVLVVWVWLSSTSADLYKHVS